MQLHPKIIDLTLDRVYRLLENLGNPHHRLPPVIHIAGTNGKGSTQAMIRAGLEAAGNTVHAYTSPHLVRFHERIRIAGKLISEHKLSELLDECEQANHGEPITYFEITTVAALLAFSRFPADYLLLEVGLGGRLDATNVIEKPALSIITSIDLDHQQFLGETIAEIAREKAGIIKPMIPVISARQKSGADEVICHVSEQKNAPLIVAGKDYSAEIIGNDKLIFQDSLIKLELPRPVLPGTHQIENAGLALKALQELGQLDAKSGAAAMQNAIWPARMQKLDAGPLTELVPEAVCWLDGGHNTSAAQAISNSFSGEDPKEIILICGMLRTKDARGYFQEMRKISSELIALSIPGEEATLRADETANLAHEAGFNAIKAISIENAFTMANEKIRKMKKPQILICGSLYLAGKILEKNAFFPD